MVKEFTLVNLMIAMALIILAAQAAGSTDRAQFRQKL
jgi:hypothetical protein